MWYEVQVLHLLGHLMQNTRQLAIGEFRGILSSLDAVVHINQSIAILESFGIGVLALRLARLRLGLEHKAGTRLF